MTPVKGALVRWRRAVEEGAEDIPYVVVKGPREGYIESGRLSQIVIVVDLYAEGRVIRGVAIDEIENWS